MNELWLHFRDENGDRRRVNVTGNSYTVGRHSMCDLTIGDSRLSREHIRIDKIGHDFLVRDLGSSNGTKINDKDISEPTLLQNGNKLNLGGLEFEVEIASDLPVAAEEPLVQPEDVPAEPNDPAPVQAAAAPRRKGVPKLALLLIPMFAIVILLFGALLIYVLVSKSGKPGNDIVIQQQDDIGDEPEDDGPNKKPPTTPQAAPPTGPTGPNTPPGGDAPPLPPSETAAVEESGAKFLRLIAQNDSKAFLTSENAKRVDARAKQFKGSSGLADNINSARKNSKEIASLAAASSLKPQLLAVAAVAKLGNSRGDVVATARSIAEVLDKLAPHIGTEMAEDALLMIAAYDQGAAGETMKMRNMLQELATKSTQSPRTVRSIWFLEKEGKITKTEFDRALTFLAVGTITQNPKAFGVNAEALTL